MTATVATRKRRGAATQQIVAEWFRGHGWQHNATVLYPEAKGDLLQRICARVRLDGECWLWTGRLGHKGYAQIRVGDGTRPVAHRVAWQLAYGPVPDGLTLDHLCRNKACVRPDHLEPVTSRENSLRGDTIAARYGLRTHCSRDHQFTPENTYLRRDGARVCRTCTRDRFAAKRAAS